MSTHTFSINQLSEITGKDRRTIKKRLKDVVRHKGAGNGLYYDSQEALKILYSADSTEDIDKRMQEETLRIECARAEKLEMDVKRLKSELVPIEDVARAVEKEYSFVRAQVRSIPSKLAKPLSMITDPHEIFNRIQEAVDECLTELTADSNYDQLNADLERSRSASEEESGDSVDAAAEDGPSTVG